jgi:hypothetical protein
MDPRPTLRNLGWGTRGKRELEKRKGASLLAKRPEENFEVWIRLAHAGWGGASGLGVWVQAQEAFGGGDGDD